MVDPYSTGTHHRCETIMPTNRSPLNDSSSETSSNVKTQVLVQYTTFGQIEQISPHGPLAVCPVCVQQRVISANHRAGIRGGVELG